ncbi:MAG TPA: hypothetical protein VD978_12135 [Azospirillum sp.]|nr:hypothetical protein [Azospirillum sp.]
MSLVATNNRIYIADGGQIVFDTNDNMPHIIGVGTYNVTVDFPDNPGKGIVSFTDACGGTQQEYQCTWENICRLQNVCRTETNYECSTNFVCEMFGGYLNCRPVTTCNWVMRTVCSLEEVCGWEQVCGFVTVCRPVTYYAQNYPAYDWESSVVIGSFPAGLPCDFVLVNAVAARTSGDGACTMPLGNWFPLSGSVVVESLMREDGTPWMRRIISVYPSGNHLILHAKSSSSAWWSDFGIIAPQLADFHSVYHLTLRVYMGKFR